MARGVTGHQAVAAAYGFAAFRWLGNPEPLRVAHGARAVRTRTEPCLLHILSAYRRACGALLDPVIPISQSLTGEGASSRDLVPLAHHSFT